MTDTPSHNQQSENAHQNPDGKRYWLDDINNVHKIFWALVVVCAGLMLADLFYHKHVVYSFENWFGFFGFFGFLLSFALVLTSKQLRKILMRDEDYYDR